MEDGDYELVSTEEVDRLKSEVARLKSNPFVKNADDMKLYEAVQDLNNSVNRLFVLFESINRQLLKEYQSGSTPDQKLDKVLEQNRSIAEALVAIGSNMGIVPQPPAPQQSSPVLQQIPTPQNTAAPLMQQSSMPPMPPMQSMQGQPGQGQNLFNDQIAMQGFRSAASQMQQNDPFQNQFNRPSQPPLPPQGAQNQQPYVDPNYPVPERFPGLNAQPSIGAPIDIQPKKKGLFSRG